MEVWITFFNFSRWDGDIITNPPYKYAQQFVEHALSITQEGTKLAFFMKLLFLEGQKRRTLFKNAPPKRIWISSSRILCAKNGKFDNSKSSAVAYCWFVWKKKFKGNPTIGWFN